MGWEMEGALNYNGSDFQRLEKWLFVLCKGYTDPSLQGWWVGVGWCHELLPPKGLVGAAKEASARARALGTVRLWGRSSRETTKYGK